MDHPLRPYRRALAAVLLASALCAAGLVLASRSTPARAAGIGQLQNQISAGQSEVRGLAGQVGAANGRIGALGGSIQALQARIGRLQVRITNDKNQLLALRSQLTRAQARLAQLVSQAARDQNVLAAQLVSTYESDSPDLVSVVLDSTGFQDLLERLSFEQRIAKTNASVIRDVRAARRAEAAAATRLGALELHQQRLTGDEVTQQNQLWQTRLGLVSEQIAVERSRDAKAGRLASARGRLSSLQAELGHLEAVQAAQAAAAARAASARSAPSAAASSSASSGSGAPASAPAPSGVASSGGFTFPLPKGSVVGPGSWSLDDGVDMAAPGDTPEYAVCSGTIVLHGIGGFGPWAPVLHCDGSLDGYSYVYYGHAGPLYQLPVGTHVSAGQVISSVGPGIVGISTGPHIEIGFADSSGNPIGPGSAPTMMSLLQSSY
jgi:murein DD-endopeptidase MepM/ murein hydrolase activator NlpD